MASATVSLRRRYSVEVLHPEVASQPDNQGAHAAKVAPLSTASANSKEQQGGLASAASSPGLDPHIPEHDASPLRSTTLTASNLPPFSALAAISPATALSSPLELTPFVIPPLILPCQQSTNKRPHFLSLPPEIRRKVYTYLPDTLASTRPLVYCLSTFPGHKQHSLAGICRLIRAEALALFVSANLWLVKLEFKIMYDAFRSWIGQLGERAKFLRVVIIGVRSRLFCPALKTRVTNEGAVVLAQTHGLEINGRSFDAFAVDGDASFQVDLSEKWQGGKVELLRNDGTQCAGDQARRHLQGLVEPLWRKRKDGSLGPDDWVYAVDQFLGYTGWWL